MKNLHVTLATSALAAAIFSLTLGRSQNVSKPAQAATENLTGLHDFDFEVGGWRVHHRVKGPNPRQKWLEFDGTCNARSLMDGRANVEDHIFNKPRPV